MDRREELLPLLGGASPAFLRRATAAVALAASGLPAQAHQPSAAPGQAAVKAERETIVDISRSAWRLHNLLPNRTLTDLAFAHMTEDPLDRTEAEQDLARACQRVEGLPEPGLFRAAKRMGEVVSGASTDVGNISFKCPVGIFRLASFPQVSTCIHGLSRLRAACRSATRFRWDPRASLPGWATTS